MIKIFLKDINLATALRNVITFVVQNAPIQKTDAARITSMILKISGVLYFFLIKYIF